MCGICGIVWRNPTEETAQQGKLALSAMMHAMRHRGPDGSGTKVTRSAAIGHLRLSIIDIDGGRQPLASPDQLVHLSYNGEVYGYQALIEAQRLRGWSFKTSSDSETLLAGYVQDGEDFDLKLNGMYAYAMLDERHGQNNLQVGIDPVGIKPLFLAETDQAVFFASELRAIVAALRNLKIPINIDQTAVSEYLTLGWVPGPRTLISGVRRLLPGERLKIDLDTAKITSLPGRDIPPADARKPDLGQTLEDAVRRQIVSDAPLGFFLSGGIDSSLLVSTAHRIGISPQTFTVRFVGEGHGIRQADEATVARLVAEHCGATHHELDVSAQTLVGELDTAFTAMDQPIADPACLPLLVMARFAREHVKVCLSGDGGDELFLGYPRHGLARLKARWRSLPAPIRSLASVRHLLPNAPANGLSEKARKLRVGIELVSSPSYFAGPFAAQHAHCLVAPPALPSWALNVAPDPESLFEADMIGQLAGQMLPKTDHITMYASLETRVPFLDHEMISAARAMPLSEKLAGGKGKAPLRALLAQYLPEDVANRPKQGFRVPMTSWFRNELADQVRSRLLDHSSPAVGLLHRPALESVINAHISGENEHSIRIWALMALQAWLDDLPA